MRQRSLTPSEAAEIRKKYNTYYDLSYADLSRMYRVSESTIRNVINRWGAYAEGQENIADEKLLANESD